QPQLPQHQPHEHQTAGVDERRPEPVRAADAWLHVRSRAVAQNRELLAKRGDARLSPWQRLLQALQPELGTLEARQELLMPLFETVTDRSCQRAIAVGTFSASLSTLGWPWTHWYSFMLFSRLSRRIAIMSPLGW